MKPTNEEVRVAILRSIGKWKSILKGNKGDLGSRNCPLCKLFNNIETYSKATECTECPVYLYSGHKFCENTPHEEWIDHHDTHIETRTLSDKVGRLVRCDQCKTLAWNEIVFLREVLENWKKSEGTEEPESCCRPPTKIIKIRITAS